MVEVFEVTIEPRFRTASIFLYRACFSGSRSVIASVIQSTFASLSRSSSILPIVMRLRLSRCVSPGWFSSSRRSMALAPRALRSSPLAGISSSRTSTPAFASCPAMPSPMVPAPITAALSILYTGVRLLDQDDGLLAKMNFFNNSRHSSGASSGSMWPLS